MLVDPGPLVVFVTAALVLLLTPGPAVLFIIARSVEQGRLAGVVSALGIGLGGVAHVVIAALGLSALLVQSALAFSAVKFLGAAYLVYLGWRTWRAPDTTGRLLAVTRQPLLTLFRQGFVVNLLNPKTALFFLAFLPQFVDPARGAVTPQILFLGAIFVALAITSDSLYALAAGTARELLAGNARLARLQKRLAAGVYIGLGLTTAVVGQGGQ